VRVISLRIEEPLLEKVEELVRRGVFKDRSELIRYAIRRLVEEWR